MSQEPPTSGPKRLRKSHDKKIGGVAGGHTQAFAVEPGAGIANKAGVAYAHPGFRRFGFAGHAGDGLFFVKAVQGHHRA